jgi:hypothetical protein
MSSDELTDVQARIVAEAQRFDLRPLLELLAEIGYTRDEVLFESAPEGRSASFVQAIRFTKWPVRSVLITVHLGLLGDNTLLPSYFFHVARSSPDPQRFYDFLRFFDHQLIENLFAAVHPEVGEGPGGGAPVRRKALKSAERTSTFGDFRGVLRTHLRMAVPGSPSTLHWLAQLYFPEFRVRVARYPYESLTGSDACRTGASRLDGSGILGKSYIAEMNGFSIDLITEDEVDLSGREQADVVVDRLRHRLLPLLAPFRLPLTIRLVVIWHSSFAEIDDPRALDKSFLGYDRLKGQREVEHTTLLYRGITGTHVRVGLQAAEASEATQPAV